MDTPLPVPRRLRIAVAASLIIAALGLLEFASESFEAHLFSFDLSEPHFPPVAFVIFNLLCGLAMFAAGLCGMYCGFGSFFRVQGFYRLIAALSGAVSFYAFLHCAAFFAGAMGLP